MTTLPTDALGRDEMIDGAPTEFLVSPSPSAEVDTRETLSRILTGEAGALLDRAMMLITELLASGEELRPTGEADSLSVKVLSVAGSVRVEVRDDGSGVVLGGLRGLYGPATHGWSPHLLSKIADRWGLVSDADGAWVWFELDLPPGGG